MARVIDKQVMLNLIIDAKRTDPETGSFAEWLAEYLVQHLPTLTQPNEWVSVEERLPEEKHRVIVRCERIGTSVGWILWGRWMTDIGTDAGNVTHWMPLPTPPDRRPPEGEEEP